MKYRKTTFLSISLFTLSCSVLGVFSVQPEVLDYIREFSVPNQLMNQVLQNATEGKISEACREDLHHYKKSIFSIPPKIWALKMLDASTKFSSGILEGNFADLGSFDECINANLLNTSNPLVSKYCIGTIYLDSFINNHTSTPSYTNLDVRVTTTPNGNPGLQFATCLPERCTTNDLEIIYSNAVFKTNFSDILCQTINDVEKELDLGAILVLLFVVAIFGVVVASTIYDEYQKHFHPEEKRSHLLTSFSLTKNVSKLWTVKENPEHITCIYGIRSITIMWIVLGHRYGVQTLFPIRNTLYIKEWMENSANMFMMGGMVAIDTFFMLSGLVVSYTFLNAMSKGEKFNIFVILLHRYVRLTGVIFILILVHLYLIKHIGSGPYWPISVQKELVDGCELYWWKALLYIQNFGLQPSICVSQSWYLSTDMQLYVFSAIFLLYSLNKWPLQTIIITGALTLLSIITVFVTGWQYQLNAHLLQNDLVHMKHYIEWYYFPPWTRASAWLIGFIFGYVLHRSKQSKEYFQRFRAINVSLPLWFVSFVVLVVCVFCFNGVYTGTYDQLANSLHMALVRPLWCIAIGWVILACSNNADSTKVIGKFLSLPIFHRLSKLTYTIYLIHYQIIYITTAQMRTAIMFGNGYAMYAFWSDFLVSILFAFMLTLAFESPLINIENYLMEKYRKPPLTQGSQQSSNPILPVDRIE